jgi:hypothetical protein
VTGEGRELAALYAWAELDVLIDLARLVALDFFNRPEFYKAFEHPETADRLGELRARYGCDERLPSREQRQATFTPIFNDPAGNFARDRDALLSAVATFAEWGQATGEPMLREAVRSAHENFLVQLTLFRGASVAWSRRFALPPLANEISYPILRDSGVSAVFGVRTPAAAEWPYRPDANGDQTVEEIAHRLDPASSPPLTRHGFRLRQRTALRGAEAIAVVLESKPTDDDPATLDRLITRCYTWYTALQGTSGLARFGGMPPVVTGDGDLRAAGAASFLPR